MPIIEVKQAKEQNDFKQIISLREKIYVREENRISQVEDFAKSFDKYNNSSVYFLAFNEDIPIGTIKVINDSDSGLPCEEIVTIKHLKADNIIVEFGHLIILPEFRYNRKIVFCLMREAFKYSYKFLNASHIVADVFIDKKRNYLTDFYHKAGFKDLFGPYQDKRFIDSPASLLIILEIEELHKKLTSTHGRRRKLLDSFLT